MSDLTQSLNRLTRNMAVTQVALHTKPPAGLFALNLQALLSSVEQAIDALESVPSNTVCVVDSPLGEHTAELLASALSSETPDTVPEAWKE